MLVSTVTLFPVSILSNYNILTGDDGCLFRTVIPEQEFNDYYKTELLINYVKLLIKSKRYDDVNTNKISSGSS